MQTATDKKIDFLNDLEGINIDSSVYPELERLSRDCNPEIRNRVAQVLGGARGEYIDILLRLMNDRDELVRVNACDSLSGTDSREAIYRRQLGTCPRICVFVTVRYRVNESGGL